jgi:glycosyltransferase involved in cell wall biosynthesis
VADDLAQLGRMDGDRIEVVYNPIERPAQISTNPAAESAWGCEGRRILSVGSLKPQKNQQLLIEAFSRLRDKSARLMILGDGPLHDALRQRAAELGVGDRVIMPGFFADPWPFYASADVFALSSDYEGFANVVVEAMAAGLKVVSTDCPHGPCEILEGGRLGRLVPCADAPALASAIEDALIDRSSGRSLVARQYLPGVVAAKYLRLLMGSDCRARNGDEPVADGKAREVCRTGESDSSLADEPAD